jgi:hypothetical protein
MQLLIYTFHLSYQRLRYEYQESNDIRILEGRSGKDLSYDPGNPSSGRRKMEA